VITPAAVASAIGAPDSVAHFQTSKIAEWHKIYTCEPLKLTFDTASGSIKRDRLSLRLAPRICEDWAGLLWGEGSHVTGNDLVDIVMGEDFYPRLTSNAESTMAMGTGALEIIADLDVTEQGTIQSVSSLYVDTVDAPNIYPLRWSRGEVTAVAFVSFDDDATHFTVRTHSHDGLRGGVVNQRFRTWGNGSRQVELPEGVVQSFTYEGAPLFRVWHTAINNAVWPKGPYGVSVLDRAKDALELLDAAFDNTVADINLGRKMIMLPEAMYRRDDSGNMIPPQKDRTQLFVSFDQTGFDSAKPFEFNPDLRVGDNTAAIETALSLAGEMVGMGAERYRYRDGQVATATQIISEQSVTYRQRAKHLKALVPALQAIAEAVAEWGQKHMDIPYGEPTVIVDDSIVTDEGTNLAEGRALHAAGLLSTEKFLTDYRKLSAEEAAEEAARLAVTPLF